MFNGLFDAMIVYLAGLIFETAVEDAIDDAGSLEFDSAFISFCAIFEWSDHRFIETVSFGNIIISLERITFG